MFIGQIKWVPTVCKSLEVKEKALHLNLGYKKPWVQRYHQPTCCTYTDCLTIPLWCANNSWSLSADEALGRDLTSSVISQIANISGFMVSVVLSFNKPLKIQKPFSAPRWDLPAAQFADPWFRLTFTRGTLMSESLGMKCRFLAPPAQTSLGLKQKSAIFNKLPLPNSPQKGV